MISKNPVALLQRDFFAHWVGSPFAKLYITKDGKGGSPCLKTAAVIVLS